METDIQRLKSVVIKHSLIYHPFLLRFREGRLTSDQVRRWLEQQFFFSISLPSAFAALFARIPDRLWKEKRSLVDLLNIEAWGAKDLEAHSRKFMRFADQLHIDINTLSQMIPKQYTKDYIEFRFQMCMERPILQSIAGIAFGNEIVNLSIFSAYREGIHKIPGLEGCDTEYFDAHIADEESDFMIFKELINALSPNEADWKLMEDGLNELLNERVNFMDRLLLDLDQVDT